MSSDVEEAETSEAGSPADLVAEIEAAAEAKRESGAHPASLDRELDWAFERVVRNRPGEDRLTHSLWSVNATAHITADAGLGETASPAKRFVKRVLAKLIRWYILRITSQVTSFAEATASSLRLISDRVEALAEEVAAIGPAPAPGRLELERGGRDASAESPLERDVSIATAAFARLATLRTKRVLHADCRHGAFVAKLASEGVDAYGVEPSPILISVPAGAGLDLVEGSVIDHLRNVPHQALAGAILSGCVDRLSVRDARRLAFLLGTRLAAGGTVCVAGTHPAAWEADATPVERDLASGRPLHPETWQHLLAEQGFSSLEITSGPERPDVAGGAASYLVTGTLPS